MLEKVLIHWVGLLQDEHHLHNVRDVWYLKSGKVRFRSNDSDGVTRYSTESLEDFERIFCIKLDV